MRRFFLLVSPLVLAAALVVVVIGLVVGVGAKPAFGEAPPTEEEQQLLELTNADRASNGLPPLEFDADTLWIARARAAAQGPSGRLSHYNGLGDLAFIDLLEAAGAPYALAGENLARATGIDSSVSIRLNEALMNSPQHRANILEPQFDKLSIGAASVAPDAIAVAEIFRATAGL